MAKQVRQKTASDRANPLSKAALRGRKGLIEEKDGTPSKTGVGAADGEASCQNSGRSVHWRERDGRASRRSLRAAGFPSAWSKIESISSANRFRNAGGCRRNAQR